MEERKPAVESEDKINSISVDDHVDRINKGNKRKVYKIGLEDVVTHDENEMSTWAPIDFVMAIDSLIAAIDEYTKINRRKLGPKSWKNLCFDIESEFGVWSAVANRQMRSMLKITAGLISKDENTEENQGLHNEFSWAYSYWWNRFTYMKEILFSRSRLGGISKKKRIAIACSNLKDLILGNLKESDMSPTFNKIVSDIKMGFVFKS